MNGFDARFEKGLTMNLQVTTIMLGVKDLTRSKTFYREGMGGEIMADYPNFVQISLGAGSSTLALYEWEAAAQDAGVSSDGSGFRGSSFHCIVQTHDEVDEIIGAAVVAGGTAVKPAAVGSWGGYAGYFSDPDGYLWKVACAS